MCAGGLSPRFYPLLTSIYPKDEVDRIIRGFFPKMSLLLNDSKIKESMVNIHIAFRKELDQYVVKKYQELGGRVLDKTKITEIDFQNNIVKSNRGNFSYKKMIAADGVNSFVRKSLLGNPQNKILVVQNWQQNHIKLDTIIVELFEDFVGYSYLFPIEDRIYLGSGGLDEKQTLEKFKEMAKKYDLRDDQIRGHFIPTGKEVFLEKDNVYFIGEAAGLIAIPTGEGMYHACYSAQRLFESFATGKNYSSLMKRMFTEVTEGGKLLDKMKEKGIFAFLQ